MSEPVTPALPAVADQLRSWDPSAIFEVIEYRGEVTLVVPREHLHRVCSYLKDEPGLEFNLLSDVSVKDRYPLEPRFDVNYHLVSVPTRKTIRLRVRLESSDPQLESVTSVWPTAAWHEREAFDLFGIRFTGHPDLRRILMPDNWEGHPLRKDYPVTGYR